jgi:hypothetical protein
VAHELDAVFLESGDTTVTAASWYGARLSPLRVDHKIKAGSEAIPVGKGMVQAYHYSDIRYNYQLNGVAIFIQAAYYVE